MRRLLPFGRKVCLFGLVLVIGFGSIGWWQRNALLRWYYVHRLSGAADGERETWVATVASLDSAVVPALLDCLGHDNLRACGNAEAVLVRLLRQWGNRDPRTHRLAEQVAERFAGFGRYGQRSALELAIIWLRAQPAGNMVPAPAAQAAGRLLLAATAVPDQGIQNRALALAEVLVDAVPRGQYGDALRALVRDGFKSPDADSRVRAAHLTLHAALRPDAELLRQVVPLLGDRAGPVRRAALLAVGMAEKTISEDDLLPLLHDPDADVRRLCEAALRSRGLQEDHLRLARLISDERPAARLEVLDNLRRTTDLEPGAWLRRLSQDPAPAVRAAAVRAAAAQTQVDLSDLIRQLAQTDPSPTVRQLAGHYWQQHVQGLAAARP
jgi:hypothetical protein